MWSENSYSISRKSQAISAPANSFNSHPNSLVADAHSATILSPLIDSDDKSLNADSDVISLGVSSVAKSVRSRVASTDSYIPPPDVSDKIPWLAFFSHSASLVLFAAFWAHVGSSDLILNDIARVIDHDSHTIFATGLCQFSAVVGDAILSGR